MRACGVIISVGPPSFSFPFAAFGLPLFLVRSGGCLPPPSLLRSRGYTDAQRHPRNTLDVISFVLQLHTREREREGGESPRTPEEKGKEKRSAGGHEAAHTSEEPAAAREGELYQKAREREGSPAAAWLLFRYLLSSALPCHSTLCISL